MIPLRGFNLVSLPQWPCICCLVFALLHSNVARTHAAPPATDLLQMHCQKCHSGASAKGQFDLASLNDSFQDKANRQRWLNVLEQITSGNMPPADEPRPDATELLKLTDWIRQQATEAEREQTAREGRVVMRRLNRAEYANTVRDLLGVEIDLTDLLPPDTSTNGFDNNAELSHTSAFLMRNYLDAADRVLDEAIANEPQPWILKNALTFAKRKRSNRPGASIDTPMTASRSLPLGSQPTFG